MYKYYVYCIFIAQRLLYVLFFIIWAGPISKKLNNQYPINFDLIIIDQSNVMSNLCAEF